MFIYFAADGDDVGHSIAQAALSNDEESLLKGRQAIELGNKVFENFVSQHGGTVFTSGDDEVRAKIPAEAAVTLPELRTEYQKITGCSISIGMGMDLAEAEKSLIYAKHVGKDRIVLYKPEIEEELNNISDMPEDHDLNEMYYEGNMGDSDAVEPINNEPLQEEKPSEIDKQLAEVNAGIHSHSLDGQLEDVNQEIHNHSLDGQLANINAQAEADSINEPQQQEQPAQEIPQEQDQQTQEALPQDPNGGMQEVSSGSPNPEDEQNGQVSVLAVIADTLNKVKEQAPYIEGLKSTNPEAYNAIKGIVQAMLAMAHELMEPEQQQEQQQGQEGQSQQPSGGGQLDTEGGDSSGLKNPEHKKYHRVTYPIGSVKNGKVKVRFSDGHTGWISVNAGQVMGQGGIPISQKTTHQELITGQKNDQKN